MDKISMFVSALAVRHSKCASTSYFTPLSACDLKLSFHFQTTWKVNKTTKLGGMVEWVKSKVIQVNSDIDCF